VNFGMGAADCLEERALIALNVQKTHFAVLSLDENRAVHVRAVQMVSTDKGAPEARVDRVPFVGHARPACIVQIVPAFRLDTARRVTLCPVSQMVSIASAVGGCTSGTALYVVHVPTECIVVDATELLQEHAPRVYHVLLANSAKAVLAQKRERV
jgi:hypothetical protein